MPLSTYLRANVATIAMLLCAVALSSFVLTVMGVASAAIAFVAAIGIVALVVAILAGWVRKHSFYDDLVACIDEEGHPLWMSEIVSRPDFLEGDITYDALDAIARSANNDVGRYRRQVSEYREYIETWVHEAKSPLAAAHLMLDNLRCEPQTDAAHEKITALDDELQRVEGYIDQALFYARSETVDRDYLIRTYRLADLVSAALRANASTLIAAHVVPSLTGLDHEVFTDEKWIEFILGQIIQNTAKYACAAEPRIEFVGKLLDEGHANERVQLAIRDNGCGVSAADLPRVFDKGFTGENGRTGKRSTGIGLYLVKRLCDKMGVGISASSQEGAGFTITLSFSTNKFRYVDREGSERAGDLAAW